jgi:hypothetical protein
MSNNRPFTAYAYGIYLQIINGLILDDDISCLPASLAN